ncbi:MAG: PaaI family thioesterase [Acidimicrobiia bacterium]
MLPEDVAGLVDRVRRHYDDGCFACGRENPIGLHLDRFSVTDATVEAWFEPRPDYRGFVGSLHGGIAATALDEILAWAGILTLGLMSVTATLDIRYRSPLTTGRPVCVHGRIDDVSGRRLRASGELISEGHTAVTAQGLYVATARVGDLLAEHTSEQ